MRGNVSAFALDHGRHMYFQNILKPMKLGRLPFDKIIRPVVTVGDAGVNLFSEVDHLITHAVSAVTWLVKLCRPCIFGYIVLINWKR